MKSLLAATMLVLSFSSFADNGTCSAGSKRIYTCTVRDGAQFDVCKTKNSQMIKVNGEEYAYTTKRTDKKETTVFAGTNTDGVDFRLQIENSTHTSLLSYLTLNPNQVNQETTTLLCEKN